MRLGQTLTTVEVEIEEEKEVEQEREIDEEGKIDAAKGVTNKASRTIPTDCPALFTRVVREE
jgi:hypothetical protein